MVSIKATVERMPLTLWKRAKVRAVELGIPLRQLVIDALVEYLNNSGGNQ